MKFSDEYREFLKRSLPAAKDASGLSEIVCRCQYCADSRDPTHGHMYISIPQSEDEPSFFDCKKCHTSGVVTNKVLMEWGIYDPQIAASIITINKNAVSHGKIKTNTRTVYQIQNGIVNIPLAEKKLDYINMRLGTSLSLQEAMDNKIVFNLKELLDGNRIIQYTRHQNIINQLNDYFVGFLSLDNNFVNLRRICEKGIVYQGIDKRYVNYNIHNKKDNTEKFYCLPVNLSGDESYRIPIHIAEGPLDILSIKYNLRRDPNAIYAAICGSGYRGLIMHLMMQLHLFYIELHIYQDNDLDRVYQGRNIIHDIKQWLRPYGIPIYVHQNTFPGEKDFGVPLSRINETIV